MAKLTVAQIVEMRRLRFCEHQSYRQIADHYGISRGYAQRMIKNTRPSSNARHLRRQADFQRLDAINQPDLPNNRLASLADTSITYVIQWRLQRGAQRHIHDRRSSKP